MLADYREWLGADRYEAVGSIGGSLGSDKIEDYYVTPFELGYDFYIGWKKDDFIGKAALEHEATNQRKKVTFEWNRDHVIKVIESSLTGRRLPVDRLPEAELRFLQRRRTGKGRQTGGHEHVQRLLLQRTLHAVAGRG